MRLERFWHKSVSIQKRIKILHTRSYWRIRKVINNFEKERLCDDILNGSCYLWKGKRFRRICTFCSTLDHIQWIWFSTKSKTKGVLHMMIMKMVMMLKVKKDVYFMKGQEQNNVFLLLLKRTIKFTVTFWKVQWRC